MTAVLFAIIPGAVTASDFQETSNQLNDQNRQAAETSAKISDDDAQLAVVQTAMDNTRAAIADTNSAIAAAKQKMSLGQARLNTLVRHEYQHNRESDLEKLASSKNFSEYVSRDEYLKASQTKIAEAVDAILVVKKELDAKSATLATLDAKLAEQQAGLAFARAQAKNQLDGINAARQALQTKIAAYGGQVVSVGQWVNPGDLIGFMGTSGCSTGAHLHFEVQLGGTPINPRSRVGNAMQWPVESFGVAQEFGPPNWNAPYSFHSGIDMTEYFGAPVHAAAGGTVVFAGYDRTGFGDHVIIDHGGGLKTIYGHMGSRASDYPAC